MEDQEMKQFSWTAFFFVTGLSFFLFSKVLGVIDGISLPVFTWIGVASFVIGLFRMIGTIKHKPGE